MTTLLRGAALAERWHSEAREIARAVGGRPPTLASVHLGAGTPFSVYLARQARSAASDGITFRSLPLPESAGSADLARAVEELNADPLVDAVLLEHPLPERLDFDGAVDRLSALKDVDGVGPENLGRLVAQRPLHVPAVARAALGLLDAYEIPTRGRSVAVVGRSPTVGLPIALLLLAKGADATVTVAHRSTRDLAKALEGAEVVIGCAGRPGLLDRRSIPQGAAVVDVGLSTVPGSDGSPKVVGDADAQALEGWASAVSPVPGGVGPVTVAALMLATAEARRALAREAR